MLFNALVRDLQLWPKFLFKKEGIIEKISDERRAYESIDKMIPSLC